MELPLDPRMIEKQITDIIDSNRQQLLNQRRYGKPSSGQKALYISLLVIILAVPFGLGIAVIYNIEATFNKSNEASSNITTNNTYNNYTIDEINILIDDLHVIVEEINEENNYLNDP